MTTPPIDIHSEWEFLTRTVYDPSVFWPMISAAASVAVVIVAWVQIRQIVKTGRADFVDRIKREFFTEDTRRIMFLVAHDFLIFNPAANGIPFFSVKQVEDQAILNRFEELGIDRSRTISTMTVDDELLGPLEDMGSFERMGNADLHTIYLVVGQYVNDVMTNRAIKQYIAWARQRWKIADMYESVEKLHKKLDRYDLKRFPVRSASS